MNLNNNGVNLNLTLKGARHRLDGRVRAVLQALRASRADLFAFHGRQKSSNGSTGSLVIENCSHIYSNSIETTPTLDCASIIMIFRKNYKN